VRADVTVNDPPGVGGLEGDGRLPGVLGREPERQGPHLVDQVEQVAAVDELLDDVGRLAVGAGVEHSGHVRVQHERGRVSAGHVVGRVVGRGEPVRFHEPEPDRLLQGGVGGLVRDARRAVGNHLGDAIPADGEPVAVAGPHFRRLVGGQPAALFGVMGQGVDVAPLGLGAVAQLVEPGVVEESAGAESFQELGRGIVRH
jgi:hypothetical protein